MLDRSDYGRTWVPMHQGTKNRARLTWSSRTTARRVERMDGLPIDPLTGEVDVAAALRSFTTEELIARLQEEER